VYKISEASVDSLAGQRRSVIYVEDCAADVVTAALKEAATLSRPLIGTGFAQEAVDGARGEHRSTLANAVR
jgi:hypothetical protein